MRRQWIVAAALCGLWIAEPSVASAGVIIASQQGYIDQNGNSGSDNYLVGNCSLDSCGLGFSGEYRDFFGFDITPFSGSVISAVLRIDTFEVNLLQSLSLTVGFTSLNTTSSFTDLGTGTPYGSFIYDAANANMTVDIPLNMAAFADITAAQGGTFLIGGRALPPATFGINDPDQYVYGFSTGNQSLIIATADAAPPGDPAAVPEPPTLVLFGAGLLGLFGFGMMRRRMRA